MWPPDKTKHFCTLLFSVILLLLLLLPELSTAQLRSMEGSTYLGTGYDLLIGNPEGRDIFQGGLDPGLKPTKTVLVTEPNRPEDACPRQASCVVLDLKTEQQDFVDDMSKYAKEFQRYWSLEDSECSSPTDRQVFHGGVSEAKNQVRELVEKQQDVLITTQTSHVMAEASYDYHTHTELHPEFLSQLCNLPEVFNEDTTGTFFNFLRMWGTHVVVGVRLGDKRIKRHLYKKDDYVNHINQSFKNLVSSTAISDDSSFATVSSAATTPYSFSIINSLVKTDKAAHVSTTIAGSRNAPVPVYIHLEDLSYFIITKYINISSGPCAFVQNETAIDLWKQAIGEATREYLKPVVTPEHNSDIIRTVYPLLFPAGTYSLPETRLGSCPSEEWSTGYRRHDLEDGKNATAWSTGIASLMKTDFGQDLQFYFCTKTTSSTRKDVPPNWPTGSYCLFKKSSCPRGFIDAAVWINDEDSSNNNKVEGTLPSGTYGHDTRYEFCCRNDGDPDEEMILPIHKPFFLLPVTHNKCQKVAGMTSELHWIKWDAEVNNSNISGGIRPLGMVDSEGNIKLYFCYYFK